MEKSERFQGYSRGYGNPETPLNLPLARDCVAMAQDRVVIPNECEGSKISPCGRNDRDDVFDVTTQSPKGRQRGGEAFRLALPSA